MYMYCFSVCKVLVLTRRSWNVLCWGNHLSAGFADVMLHSPSFGKDIPFSNFLFILRGGDGGDGLGSR